MCARALRFLVLGLLWVAMTPQAQALPWDTDMYEQQSYEAGEMSRVPAKGSIPLGYRPYTLTIEEAASNNNPKDFTLHSVWQGMRLYNANCYTCHGKRGDGQGPVGPQMAVPSLLEDFYKNRPDGVVYHVIQRGGVSMPRYGYKFSADESWDIVNYVRFLQGRDVEGLQRPAP